MPVPPTFVEQRAICERLRSSLSSIDASIDRLEREIELLREYRTRLVADVVTSKIDVRDATNHLGSASLLDSKTVPLSRLHW